jgi:hypothetical protein
MIQVPFPKPRAIDVVTTPEFVAIKDHVLRLIRDEFARSDRAAQQAGLAIDADSRSRSTPSL